MAENSYMFRINDRQAIQLEGGRPLDPEKDRDMILSRLTEAGVKPAAAAAAYEKWRRELPVAEVVEPVVAKIPSPAALGSLAGEIAISGGLEGGATAAGQAFGAALPIPGGTSLGGAVGAGVGNLANQFRRMAQGKQDRWTPRVGELATATLTGAIPGSFLTKTGGTVARAIKGGVRDAATNLAAGESAIRIDEGRAPTAGERVLGGALGAAGGSLAGAVHRQVRPLPDEIRESVREAALAKQRLSERTGLPYTSTRQEVNPRVAAIEDELKRNESFKQLGSVADQNYRAQQAVQNLAAGGRTDAPTAPEIGERLRGYVGGQELDPAKVAQVQARMAEGIGGRPGAVGARSQIAATEDLGGKIRDWVEQTKAQSNQLYDEAHAALREAYGGNQEPTFYPKRTAESAKALVAKLAPSDEARFRESIGILEDLDRGDLTIDQLRNKRSLIGSIVKGEAGELGAGIQKGQLDQLYKALTKDLDEIYDSLGPGIREKFAAANQHFRQNIEKSNLYNIEKAMASPEGRQNMAKTIVSEITSGGESQSLRNIENVLGGPDAQLDGFLRDAILDRNFDRVGQRLKLDGLYSDAYNITKKSPELAKRLSLGQGDTLMQGRIALETFQGGKSVDIDLLSDAMRRLNLKPDELLADSTAIKRLLEAQKTRDSARTSALVNVLNNTGTDLRKLTDPKGIYNSVFNGENTTVDQLRDIVSAFEQRAASGSPDAGVAESILKDVRSRKVLDFFDAIKSTASQSRASRAIAEQAGAGFPEIDPVKLQSVLKDTAENRKLSALIGQEKWWLLQDLAKAESAIAESANTMQAGMSGGVSEVARMKLGSGLSLWGRAQATLIPFMANVFADPDIILTPKGRLGKTLRSGEWLPMVTRRAAATGTPENRALLEAIASIGGVDASGQLTSEGQQQYDAITSPYRPKN